MVLNVTFFSYRHIFMFMSGNVRPSVDFFRHHITIVNLHIDWIFRFNPEP